MVVFAGTYQRRANTTIQKRSTGVPGVRSHRGRKDGARSPQRSGDAPGACKDDIFLPGSQWHEMSTLPVAEAEVPGADGDLLVPVFPRPTAGPDARNLG
jgi:hypothetical protein